MYNREQKTEQRKLAILKIQVQSSTWLGVKEFLCLRREELLNDLADHIDERRSDNLRGQIEFIDELLSETFLLDHKNV